MGDDAIDKISKSANYVINCGIDVVEKYIQCSVEEVTEYSKEISAYYALRKFDLNRFGMSKKKISIK